MIGKSRFSKARRMHLNSLRGEEDHSNIWGGEASTGSKPRHQRRNSAHQPASHVADSHLVSSILQFSEENNEFEKLCDALTYRSIDGKVDYTVFKETMKEINPRSDPVLTRQLFLAMKPTIDVDSAIGRLRQINHGTLRDAARFSFDVYDIEGDGKMKIKDFVRILRKTVQHNVGDSHSGSVNDLWIQSIAQTLFAKIEGDSMTFHQFEEVLYAMYESSSMTDYSDMESY